MIIYHNNRNHGRQKEQSLMNVIVGFRPRIRRQINDVLTDLEENPAHIRNIRGKAGFLSKYMNKHDYSRLLSWVNNVDNDAEVIKYLFNVFYLNYCWSDDEVNIIVSRICQYNQFCHDSGNHGDEVSTFYMINFIRVDSIFNIDNIELLLLNDSKYLHGDDLFTILDNWFGRSDLPLVYFVCVRLLVSNGLLLEYIDYLNSSYETELPFCNLAIFFNVPKNRGLTLMDFCNNFSEYIPGDYQVGVII